MSNSYSFSIDIKRAVIAGPSIIPQNPNVESPAIIAKNISNSFTCVGTFANVFIYFIISGLVRSFYIDNKGNEKITQFAIENWWITNMESFIKKTQRRVVVFNFR